MTLADLDRLEALAKAEHGAEWFWSGYPHRPTLTRQEPGHGHVTVMGFARAGMQGGQPVFNRDGLLVKGQEVARFEVTYRQDIVGYDHPTADFIAAANPATVLALVERVRDLEETLADIRAHYAATARGVPS